MNALPFPVLWLAAAVPLLGAALARLAADRRHAFRWATLAHGAAVVVTGGVLAAVLRAPAGVVLADPMLQATTHPLLATDIEGALVAFLAAVVGLLVLAAMPRRTLSQASIVRVARATGLSVLTFYAGDLVVLTAAWSAIALPLRSYRNRVSAGDAATLRWARANLAVLGIAPLVLAVVWWGSALGFRAGAYDLFRLGTQPVSATTEAVVVALVVFASASRMGVAPLHGWFPVLMRRGMAPYAMTLLAPLSGAFVLLRIGPALAGGFVTQMPWIEAVGLTSAAYLGLVAWGQREQLRHIEYLVLSQTSIVFLALCTTDATTIEGGLTMWVAQGLASTGLVLTATAVHSRLGELDLMRFHGVAAAAPQLTALMFVFGAAVVGIPGTLTFVAEDIIAQGLLIPHPWLAAGFMLVTALNAIGFFRAFIHVHLGKSLAEGARCPELQPRERIALLALAGAVVFTGVVPRTVIEPGTSVVQRVVDMERGAPSHANVPTPR